MACDGGQSNRNEDARKPILKKARAPCAGRNGCACSAQWGLASGGAPARPVFWTSWRRMTSSLFSTAFRSLSCSTHSSASGVSDLGSRSRSTISKNNLSEILTEMAVPLFGIQSVSTHQDPVCFSCLPFRRPHCHPVWGCRAVNRLPADRPGLRLRAAAPLPRPVAPIRLPRPP